MTVNRRACFRNFYRRFHSKTKASWTKKRLQNFLSPHISQNWKPNILITDQWSVVRHFRSNEEEFLWGAPQWIEDLSLPGPPSVLQTALCGETVRLARVLWLSLSAELEMKSGDEKLMATSSPHLVYIILPCGYCILTLRYQVCMPYILECTNSLYHGILNTLLPRSNTLWIKHTKSKCQIIPFLDIIAPVVPHLLPPQKTALCWIFWVSKGRWQ